MVKGTLCETLRTQTLDRMSNIRPVDAQSWLRKSSRRPARNAKSAVEKRISTGGHTSACNTLQFASYALPVRTYNRTRLLDEGTEMPELLEHA